MTEQSMSIIEGGTPTPEVGNSSEVFMSSEVEMSSPEAGETGVDEEDHVPAPELSPLALALVSLGVEIASLANAHELRFTIVLCLPFVDYAASLIGLGIIKDRLAVPNTESAEDRLSTLIGQWVSFEKNGATNVGVLERCPIDRTYEIRVSKKQGQTLWEVPAADQLHLVQPTGREFNPNRKLSQNQVYKVHRQNDTIITFGDLLECDLRESALTKSGDLFSIYGNKARIFKELDLPMFANDEGYLGKVLRPREDSSNENSFHCSIQSSRNPIAKEPGEIIIIEANRSLPDQLASSRQLNRVILLGRNMPEYNDLAGLILQEKSLGGGNSPNLETSLTPSIKILSFYQR
jgi:hypothetical protein